MATQWVSGTHRHDPGPFRFTEIHGPHRSRDQRSTRARLLRRHGYHPARCEFALEKVPLRDLIESLLAEAHDRGTARSTMSMESAGSTRGAVARRVRASYDAARQRRPQDTPRLDTLESLYASGIAVEPLIAVPRARPLSSGDAAFTLLDGRHRTFAAAHVGIERLPVFVLLSAMAVFPYQAPWKPRYCAAQKRRPLQSGLSASATAAAARRPDGGLLSPGLVAMAPRFSRIACCKALRHVWIVALAAHLRLGFALRARGTPLLPRHPQFLEHLLRRPT